MPMANGIDEMGTNVHAVQAHGLGTDLWNIPFGDFNLLLWARVSVPPVVSIVP